MTDLSTNGKGEIRARFTLRVESAASVDIDVEEWQAMFGEPPTTEALNDDPGKLFAYLADASYQEIEEDHVYYSEAVPGTVSLH